MYEHGDAFLALVGVSPKIFDMVDVCCANAELLFDRLVLSPEGYEIKHGIPMREFLPILPGGTRISEIDSLKSLLGSQIQELTIILNDLQEIGFSGNKISNAYVLPLLRACDAYLAQLSSSTEQLLMAVIEFQESLSSFLAFWDALGEFALGWYGYLFFKLGLLSWGPEAFEIYFKGDAIVSPGDHLKHLGSLLDTFNAMQTAPPELNLLQKNVLKKLEGRFLKLEALAEAVDLGEHTNRLYRDAKLRLLRTLGLIGHKPGRGFFNPAAPPDDL